MRQSIAHVALVVRDYDEAIAFFTQRLHFVLVEDQYQPAQDKRWVDFWRDYHEMVGLGIRFVRPPSEELYGLVAVFEDLYGNRWDLVQYAEKQP
jgi:catechol 2,3-dioxygenase-like lactoylglutathione lyase family enzyme